jgi:hypothetical protein
MKMVFWEVIPYSLPGRYQTAAFILNPEAAGRRLL